MKVVVSEVRTYDADAVSRGVMELLAALGGMEAFVQAGERVLIKPNMVEGLPPEKAVTTHPELVRACIRQVKQAGAIPLVGDSPGVVSTLKAAQRCGIYDVCRQEGAELLPFTEIVYYPFPAGVALKRFSLAKDLQQVDKVISLAKMKTHSFTDITGTVKNLFGLLVGTDKAQFHLRMKKRGDFAAMLIDLYRLVRPVLNIVDGIVGMEGNGPRNGIPKQVGVLLAGANGFAVDMVMADIMGFNGARTPVLALALERGLVRPLAEIGREGSGASVKTTFMPPKNLESLEGRLPVWLVNFCQDQLTATPAIEAGCAGCGRCAEHCPPKAIRIENSRAVIDYPLCIRCYCCQELCPFNAVRLKEGMILRTVRRILQRTRS